MMVAAVAETTSRIHRTRPPLLPSEKDNGMIIPKNSTKSKQIPSRYVSPSPSSSSNSNLISSSNSNSSSIRTVTPSRRSPSPLISRNSTTPVAKRSVSADRRRPTRLELTLKPNNADGAGEVSAATKLLVTSTRSLSVSFQGEAFSLPISKTKVTPESPNLIRKRTPTSNIQKIDSEVGDQFENTKPMDYRRWPPTIRQPNVSVLSKSLSLECGIEKNKMNLFSGNVIGDLKLHHSVYLDCRRASIEGDKLNIESGDPVDVLSHIQENPDGNSVYSDTDSVSSGSTSGIQENGLNLSRSRPGGIIVSSKFWQETNSRMRRLQDPSSLLPTSPGPKLNTPQKNFISKKLSCDNPSSSPRTMASPNRMRPSSPSKFLISSPSRGMISPRRNSVSGICSNFIETPSVLSFAVDVRRGKVGENRFFDAHLLRILYNRHLQLRLVNARTEDTILKQRHRVEETLWNAWIRISDLRDSVTKKRHRLKLLRQKLKLASLLKAHMVFLEDWACLDKDHSVSLLGAIESLKASTLRLPVGAGATADLQSMKDAISSALHVMQAMGSSINSVCLQVEKVNLMVAEIVNVSAKERALLRICKDLLSFLSALKVKDCSLRTHVVQTNRVK